MMIFCDSCGRLAPSVNETEDKINYLIILDQSFDPNIKGKRIIHNRELHICPDCRIKILKCINENRKGPAMMPIEI